MELEALLSAAGGVREALQAAQQRTAMRHGSPYAFRQLSRLTISADDPAAAAAACSSALVAGSYDLLAVAPGSERVFAQACASLPIDVITLDLSKRLPFRLKTASVAAALKRGVSFEICYAPALRDAGSRRQLLANAAALVRETRGRGLLLSAGARSLWELRGPYDIANLAAALFGLSQAQAAAAVGRNAEACLARAQQRRAWKGVVAEVQLKDASDAAGQQQQLLASRKRATPG